MQSPSFRPGLKQAGSFLSPPDNKWACTQPAMSGDMDDGNSNQTMLAFYEGGGLKTLEPF